MTQTPETTHPETPQTASPSPVGVPVSAGRWASKHTLLALCLALIWSIYTIAQWSLGYIDFGDGNYMYIARRIAEGAVVYRDILAPQPPCHLFAGALVWKIAWLLNLDQPVYAFRAFSLLIHLVIFAEIVALAWHAWGRGATALLAGAIYLWLPMANWWSLGYQSEPLEIAFLLAMMLAALRGTRGGDIATGLFAALAALTNATAAPFLLVMILYSAIRMPRRALRMTIPCVILAALVTVVLELWTGGHYLENVVFNQVGTYPDDVLGYAVGKIAREMRGILSLEGGFVILACLGFSRFLRDSPLEPIMRDGLAWFMLATLGAIVYVSKGGTMNYIFTLSEPAVALLAAGEIAAVCARIHESRRPLLNALSLPVFAILLVLSGAILLSGFAFHLQMWRHNAPPYEINESAVERITFQIKEHSSPGDLILSPPFYAVLADRTLWGDYSELFIWTMKYRNETLSGDPSGGGIEKTEAMAEALRQRQISLAVLELDQTGRLPIIQQALRAHFVPIRANRLPPPQGDRFIVPTNNTRLALFIPVGDVSASDREIEWAAFVQDLATWYDAQGIAGYPVWTRSTSPGQGSATP